MFGVAQSNTFVEVDQTETGNEGTSPIGAFPRVLIKNADMSEAMQQESLAIAAVALEKSSVEKDIAASIKKEFDRRHGPTWHVVVGKNYGSYVTHGMSVLQSLLDRNSEYEQ